MILIAVIVLMLAGVAWWLERRVDKVNTMRRDQRREQFYPYGKPEMGMRTPSDPKYQAEMKAWYARLMETGEYREREDVFDELLKRRNPRRNRGGGGCLVCGESHGVRTIDNTPINDSICASCAKQLRAKFAEINRSDDGEKQTATQQKIIRCMTISYDLIDHVISEACARADMDAAEHFEEMTMRRIIQGRENQARMAQEAETRRTNERAATEEVLRRLMR